MWQVWGQGAGHKTLWRADWTAKPAGEAWLDQVYKQWWTETAGKSASDGTFETRGFHGDYLITTRLGNQTRTLRTQVAGDTTVLEIVF